MEITMERYEELIIAEQNYKKLCNVINEYAADGGYGLGCSELKLLRCMICPDGEQE